MNWSLFLSSKSQWKIWQTRSNEKHNLTFCENYILYNYVAYTFSTQWRRLKCALDQTGLYYTDKEALTVLCSFVGRARADRAWKKCRGKHKIHLSVFSYLLSEIHFLNVLQEKRACQGFFVYFMIKNKSISLTFWKYSSTKISFPNKKRCQQYPFYETC